MPAKRELRARLRAEELAAWCLLTGFPPEVRIGLSRIEKDAFLRVAQDLRKKGWR
jgi:hypothetical protein